MLTAAVGFLGLVAAGFAIAAGTMQLIALLGPILGLAAMAGGFAIVACVVAGVAGLFSPSSPEAGAAKPARDARTGESSAQAEGSGAGSVLELVEQGLADREFALTVATALLPVALPIVLKGFMRNAPLLLIAAMIGWLGWNFFGRPSSDDVARSSTS